MRNYLASHPEIFFSEPDEPGYFDRKFRFVTMDECAYRSLDDYLSIYGAAREDRHKAVGEGSVYMMYSREILDEILSVCPDSKFIIMLRNPYLAAVSMHGENLKSFNLGREPMETFADAWADLKNRNVQQIAGVHPMRFRYDVLFSYNSVVQVAKEVLGSRNLRIILYDDFKDDNLRVAKSVYEFLGVDRHYVPKVLTINERSQAKNNLAAWLVSKAALAARKYRVLRPLRGRGLSLNRFTQEKLAKPEISEQLMEDMRDVFHDDICALEQTIGKDLGAWKASDMSTTAA